MFDMHIAHLVDCFCNWYLVKPEPQEDFVAYKKLIAPTLKELFVKELEGMILSGELKIGEKLPSERDLAARMQISRSAVNDGIVEMARKGFLETKSRSGTYVADYHKQGTLEILLSIMSYNGGHLSKDEVRSILEMRGVFMCFAAQTTIPSISEAHIDELQQQANLLSPSLNPSQAANVCYTFDHMFSGFSTNTLLPLFFCSFKAPITVLWERYFMQYGNEVMIRRNEDLLGAIRDRNICRAQSVINRSVGETILTGKEIFGSGVE